MLKKLIFITAVFTSSHAFAYVCPSTYEVDKAISNNQTYINGFQIIPPGTKQRINSFLSATIWWGKEVSCSYEDNDTRDYIQLKMYGSFQPEHLDRWDSDFGNFIKCATYGRELCTFINKKD